MPVSEIQHGYTIICDSFARPFMDVFFETLENPILVKSVLTDERVEIHIQQRLSNTTCVVYNTEQLTRRIWLQSAVDTVKDPLVVQQWDYSVANLDLLKAYLCQHQEDSVYQVWKSKLRWMPLKVGPFAFQKQSLAWSQTKEYDVGFCGVLTPRRQAVLTELGQQCKVNFVTSSGPSRDSELGKCQIVLNIHAGSDQNVLETARVGPWLDVGALVVTESSLDNDARAITVPQSQLVSMCLRLLACMPPLKTQ